MICALFKDLKNCYSITENHRKYFFNSPLPSMRCDRKGDDGSTMTPVGGWNCDARDRGRMVFASLPSQSDLIKRSESEASRIAVVRLGDGLC